ncbi:hypothetical protein EVG20_g7587 [Dentipellis fragilis]|uniref:Uncharacterized protein n=1 Tax=Dentipellis fragilis TaxID=205917 RepID=A0A4Y9YEJ9_9AGAM|nr:hypothetical protein EVG20_g7587 [Dentipellis fragilis]
MSNVPDTDYGDERLPVGEVSGSPSIAQHDAEMHRRCQVSARRLQIVEEERDAAIRELASERLKHPAQAIAPVATQPHSPDTVNPQEHRHRRRAHQEMMPAGKERSALELLARKYCVMYSFWLPHETVLQVLPDPTYDPAHRFSSPAMRIQGQMADLMKVLPKEYQMRIHLEPWVNTWETAMQQQRSNCVSRVRECAMAIFGCTAAEISTSAARLAAFKHDIGYATHHNGRGYYKAMAPILYDGYEGEHDASKVFLNPKLLKVFAVLVLGPSALNDAGTYYARAHTVYKLWKLRRTTAGAIATSAILARFILSADANLEANGRETRIHYQDDFNSYVEYLLTGLNQRDPSVLGIFEKWNKAFFSESHLSEVGDHDSDDPMDGSTRHESETGSESEYDGSAAAALAALRSEPSVPVPTPVPAPEPECRHHLKTEVLPESVHAHETGKRTREPSLEDSKAEVTALPRKKIETDEVDHKGVHAIRTKQHKKKD